MSGWCLRGCCRTNCSLRPRSASSTPTQFPSWDTSFPWVRSRWIPSRSPLSRSVPNQNLANNYKGSWGLPTFANNYRRFIRNYSRIAAPLTALTSTTRTFAWTPEASSFFQDLKRRFTRLPYWSNPTPNCSSSLKWMHQIPVWMLSCLNTPLSTTNYIPALSSLAG